MLLLGVMLLNTDIARFILVWSPKSPFNPSFLTVLLMAGAGLGAWWAFAGFRGGVYLISVLALLGAAYTFALSGLAMGLSHSSPKLEWA